jgi:hypothetical protein
MCHSNIRWNFFLSLILSINLCWGHQEGVHQYICRESYKLLKAQIGVDINPLKDRVGNDQQGNGQFYPGGLIVIGAYQEDHTDPVFRYGVPHDPLRETVAVTHYWDADQGDNSEFCTHFCINPFENCYTNSYVKAQKYLYGGWELQVYIPGMGIVEAYEAPASLTEYYRTGRIFYKGYYDISTRFISRNYWATSSQEFRDIVVWEILGRVAHLLQDMSVPAHAHNDQHDPICGGTDTYEPAVANIVNTWNYTNALNAGGFINVCNVTNPLKYLFYTTNQIADHFPSNDFGGDNSSGVNESFSNYPELQSIISSLGPPPTTINVNQIANTTLVYAIRATAGLFYWFANEASILPRPFNINLSAAQFPEGYGSGGSYRINSTDVGSSWSGSKLEGSSIEAVPPPGFGFVQWSDGIKENYRTLSGDVNIYAIYKAPHKSDNSSAFSNNSQRKLVRTHDGWLHQVYESIGRVWLEHSTNNGSTWTLGNNGQPLDNGAGKCPSIDWFAYGGYNALVVAFQQRNGNTYTIQISPFSCQNGKYINMSAVYGKSNLLYTETVDPYTTNANPNITRGYGYSDNSFVLTFERKSGSTAGINWFCGKIYDYGFYPNDYFAGPVWISGTNSNSINASVHLNKTNSYPGNFDVVFQQYVSGASGSIKDVYLYFYKNGQDQWVTIQPGSPFVISSSTGVSNYKPSMVQMPDCNVRVCWIRSLNGQPQNSPFSVNVVYWNSATPSQYSIYGWSTQSVSLNVRDDNARTFYALSQYSSSNQWENYISNGSSYVKLSTSGKDVQLSNGPLSGTSSLMYTSSFYPFTLPYYFANAGVIGGQLQKSSSNQINYGRGAVLTKGDAQFSYSLKSLTVDNTNIKFIDLPESKTDTTKAFRHLTEKDMYYPNLDSLNAVLLSEPFMIKNNSSISLSEQAGFIDSLAAIKALGSNGYVAYRLELIDNATNKTIAAIKSSKFSAANVSLCNLSASNLNASKVGTKTVRIRITLSTNITDMQGALVNEYGTIDFGALAKSTVNEITLQGSEIIEEYALEQNYPNPFNPSTTVRYQIPNAGHVILKVYDMLGREVATLVDQEQEQGRYSAAFDASRLASGVYISRLTAGDYTKTIKLLFLK